MKDINRGTTPLLKFDYPYEYGYLTDFTITFAQDGNIIFKLHMGDSEIYLVEDRLITVELTEAETLLFKHNFPLEAQLKTKNLDGEVWAGDIHNYQVHRTLDEEPFAPAPEPTPNEELGNEEG